MPSHECGFDYVEGESTGGELLVDFGPTIEVDIGFDEHYIGAGGVATAPPKPGIKEVRALIDTGATQNCIDSMLAARLGLPVIDRKKVSGVNGEMEVNVHLAQVHVPQLGRTISGRFFGVHLHAGGQQHSALIGRDFLRHVRMVYDGVTGKVTLSVD